MKWEDLLRRFAKSRGLGAWTAVAERREQWANLATRFSEQAGAEEDEVFQNTC